MKTYRVTFREWMYQEKEIEVIASSKKEAIDLADEEMLCPQEYVNEEAEWYSSKFKILKPKVRVKK